LVDANQPFEIFLIPPTPLRGKRKPSSMDGEKQETIASYTGRYARPTSLGLYVMYAQAGQSVRPVESTAQGPWVVRGQEFDYIFKSRLV
jgi:hypothetical protein